MGFVAGSSEVERRPKMSAEARALCVADASVILKWYCLDSERDVEKALKLRDDFRSRRIELIEPELLIYEIANVLRYKESLEEGLVRKAVVSIFEMRILRPVNQEMMEEAVRLARVHETTVYDSTYISFAHHFGCRFITADRKLQQRIGALPNCLSLEEY